MLRVVELCAFCDTSTDRIWIDSEQAVGFAPDAPVVDGPLVIAPKEHVPSIYALSHPAQKAVWAAVAYVRRRLRTRLDPDDGFAIGVEGCLTGSEAVTHTVIHIIQRRTGETVILPICSEWIDDDNLMA